MERNHLSLEHGLISDLMALSLQGSLEKRLEERKRERETKWWRGRENGVLEKKEKEIKKVR